MRVQRLRLWPHNRKQECSICWCLPRYPAGWNQDFPLIFGAGTVWMSLVEPICHRPFCQIFWPFFSRNPPLGRPFFWQRPDFVPPKAPATMHTSLSAFPLVIISYYFVLNVL